MTEFERTKQDGLTNDKLNYLLSKGVTLDEMERYSSNGISLDELVQALDHIKAKIVTAAEIKAGERTFLRYPDFPFGEVCIIAGAGGIGKGQFGCFVLACLSVGIDYRTGRKTHEPCNSLFVSTEDTAADIRARLDRAEIDADLRRIFIVDKLASFEMGLTVSDDEGLSKIEALIEETQAKFVILDPLQGLCGQDVDMSRTNHIRRIMHGLAAVAERTQSVICLYAHPNKRQSIASANDLISGSADIVSAARSVLLLMPDFESNDADCRLIIHTKSNHARPGRTMRFRIADGNRVVGLSDVTAADAVEAVNFRKLSKPASKGVVDYEQQFIDGVLELLADGKPMQKSFREFIAEFAPSFDGKPKVIFDRITDRLAKEYGIRLQTSAGKSEIRVNGSRGFRCDYIENSVDVIDEQLPL